MEIELICLRASIAIVSAQINGFSYCYLALIIPFDINHLFEHSVVVTSIAFEPYTFIHTVK